MLLLLVKQNLAMSHILCYPIEAILGKIFYELWDTPVYSASAPPSISVLTVVLKSFPFHSGFPIDSIRLRHQALRNDFVDIRREFWCSDNPSKLCFH